MKVLSNEVLTKKINALKTAKDSLIHNPDQYYWGNAATCNCGIVAQACELTADQIHLIGCWSTKSYSVCKQTNLPFHVVVTTLRDNGFYASDIRHLEMLSNRKYNKGLITKYGIQKYSKREAVIDYISNWINDLEQQVVSQAIVHVPAKTKLTYTQNVSCSVN